MGNMFGGLWLWCLVSVACGAPANQNTVAQEEKPEEVRVVEAPSPVEPCAHDRSTFVLPAGVDRKDARWEAAHLVVVRKAVRRVLLYRSGVQAGCWPAGLGFSPEGHKSREGDGRTPEGWYRTSDKPTSRYYHAIAVHYPNTLDAERGLAEGRIDEATDRAIQSALSADRKPPQNTPLGGEILLHGGGSASDWTLGCVAMENDDIDALRAALPDGLKVDVVVLP